MWAANIVSHVSNASLKFQTGRQALSEIDTDTETGIDTHMDMTKSLDVALHLLWKMKN